MTNNDEQICPHHHDYERMKIFEDYFVLQIFLLKDIIELLSDSDENKISNILPILFDINSSGKAIVNLIGGGFVPQAYIIARSFLEKCVNLCYLLICDEEEFKDYIDYSKQKIIRSLYSNQKAYNSIGKEICLPDILNVIEKCDELKKFTKKGREIKKWTNKTIYERIEITQEAVKNFNGPIYKAATNFIYADASEYSHGTLYGSLFHSGLFYGIKDKNEAYNFLMGLGSNLYMLLGFLIHGLLKVFSTKISCDNIFTKSVENYHNKIVDYYENVRPISNLSKS